MSTPLITALITTHNYGQFVEGAIDSVLSQDYPPDKIQVLVVDDGSTDDTSERVKKYGSHIDYFHKPNGGQASALNFGFAKARGEIVALLDADDLFLPGKLARVAEAFGGDPALGMVYHRLREWHVRTEEWRDWEFVGVSGDIHKQPAEFMLFTPQPTSALSFRRSLLNGLLPIPEQIAMLADCYLAALFPFLAPVMAIPEFLAVYRVHGSNAHYESERQLPSEIRKRRLEMWQKVVEAMRKWLAGHGFSRKLAPVRAMLDKWTNILEREEFGATPPGRVRFFRHLLRTYRYQWPLMTRRLRLINCFNAAGSLVVGYKKFHWLDEGREDITHWVRSIVRKESTAGRSNTPR